MSPLRIAWDSLLVALGIALLAQQCQQGALLLDDLPPPPRWQIVEREARDGSPTWWVVDQRSGETWGWWEHESQAAAWAAEAP